MSRSDIQVPFTNSFVQVNLLNAGSMEAEYHKLHAGADQIRFRMYNWAFFVCHGETGRHLLWDLGMAPDKEKYPPIIANGPWVTERIVGPHESLAEQIQRRTGMKAQDIKTIVLSHAHFDHCWPTRDIFPNATSFFGPGTSEHCAPGHFQDPSSIWDGRFFDPEQATECWETLKGPWVRFGAFEKAMDFFGDGSFWIIQAPGHMPGNLCACARLENGEWVMLASDCCHSREILDGKKDFGQFLMPDGKMVCLHTDVAAAKDTLCRVRVMEKEMGFHIALAHDCEWMKKKTDSVLMSLLDEKFIQDIDASLDPEKPF